MGLLPYDENRASEQRTLSLRPETDLHGLFMSGVRISCANPDGVSPLPIGLATSGRSGAYVPCYGLSPKTSATADQVLTLAEDILSNAAKRYIKKLRVS